MKKRPKKFKFEFKVMIIIFTLMSPLDALKSSPSTLVELEARIVLQPSGS